MNEGTVNGLKSNNIIHNAPILQIQYTHTIHNIMSGSLSWDLRPLYSQTDTTSNEPFNVGFIVAFTLTTLTITYKMMCML